MSEKDRAEAPLSGEGPSPAADVTELAASATAHASADGFVSSVFVRQSPGRGRGVFAGRRFAPGEIIERAPVIVCTPVDARHLYETPLEAYTYVWPDGCEAVVLGFGMLYNHSFRPNATYTRRITQQLIEYSAISEIGEGEEIFVNYGGSPDATDTVWFDSVER